jgi:hypothetical protein
LDDKLFADFSEEFSAAAGDGGSVPVILSEAKNLWS